MKSCFQRNYLLSEVSIIDRFSRFRQKHTLINNILFKKNVTSTNLPRFLCHNFFYKNLWKSFRTVFKIIFQWSDITFLKRLKESIIKRLFIKVLWSSCFYVLRKVPIKLSSCSSYFSQVAHFSLVKYKKSVHKLWIWVFQIFSN